MSQKSDLILLLEGRSSLRVLSEHFNLSISDLKDFIKEHNVGLGSKNHTQYFINYCSVHKSIDKKTIEQRQNLTKQLYNEGFSFHYLARLFGCSAAQICNLFKFKDWSVRSQHFKDLDEKKDYVEYLYCYKKWSVSRIARKYSVNRMVISRILKLNSVEIEDKYNLSEAHKHADKIVGEYVKEKKSIKHLSEKYEAYTRTIKRILLKNGVTLRSTKDKSTNKLNEEKRYKRYRRLVNSLSERSFSIKVKLDPQKCSERSSELHMDHEFSVYDSFYNHSKLKNPITLEEVSHPANLVLKSRKENLQKREISGVSATELRKRIKIWNTQHGNPYV